MGRITVPRGACLCLAFPSHGGPRPGVNEPFSGSSQRFCLKPLHSLPCIVLLVGQPEVVFFFCQTPLPHPGRGGRRAINQRSDLPLEKCFGRFLHLCGQSHLFPKGKKTVCLTLTALPSALGLISFFNPVHLPSHLFFNPVLLSIQLVEPGCRNGPTHFAARKGTRDLECVAVCVLCCCLRSFLLGVFFIQIHSLCGM